MTAYTPSTSFTGAKVFVATNYQRDYGQMLATFSDALQKQQLVENLGGWTIATRDVHEQADDAWTDLSVQIDSLLLAMPLTTTDHHLHHFAGLIHSALSATSANKLFSFWHGVKPGQSNGSAGSHSDGCEVASLVERTLAMLDVYCKQMLRLVKDDAVAAPDRHGSSDIAIA